MRPFPLFLKAAVFGLLLLPPVAARAQSLRVVATDEHGVTLRLSLPAYRLSAPLADGRVELNVPGYGVTSQPGRPNLPFAQALVALPPGARAQARIVELGEEEVRDGLRIHLGAKPVMNDGGEGFGPTPGLEPVPPILDGPWPVSPLELSEPATVRRQRLVAVQVWPFRYDEASGRLWVRHSLTVRVDFAGGQPGAATSAPVSDSHWDPVFRNALANYEQGRRWRAPRQVAAPGSGLPGLRSALPATLQRIAAFDESAPEVRIKVDTTGVYAFPFTELAAQGYPANVPVGQVSLHRHEYVGPADPPYVTIELPIEVDDANANGVFDEGDAIVAFVANWVDRSGVTSLMQRDWGDAEVVYATQTTGPGLRIPSRPGWLDAVSPALPASYPWTQRWERTFIYFAYPAPTDTAVVDRFLWTNYFLYYGPGVFPFEVNHLDASRPVLFRTRLVGESNEDHVMFGQVRNGLGHASTVVDSVTWYGKTALTVSPAAPLAPGALTEGATNSVTLWGKGSTDPPNPSTNGLCKAGLDWFEATYWRAYRALGGYLAANSGDVTGDCQVHATGFSGPAIRVYDVTDSVGPVRLDVDPSHIVAVPGAGYAIDFQDAIAAGPHRYVVFDQPKALPSTAYSTVTRRQLTAPTGERDYVVVVPEAFQAAVDPLVTLRQSEGLATVVAPLESVFDEFNGGRKSAWAIKRFLRYAMETWNARFVLLVGDGSADPRNLIGTAGTDWVPAKLIPGPVSSGFVLGLEMIPSDPWYGWCLDEDPACAAAALIEPDLYVGRLPVNSLQQARDVVAKLVAYEAFDADQDWRRRMVLLADDHCSGVTTFGGGGGGTGYCFRGEEVRFRQLSQATAAVIADSSGLDLASPEVIDLGDYLLIQNYPGLYQVTGADTCRVGPSSGETAAEGILRARFDPVLFQKLNEGALWWNYQGHANPYVLSHEGFYRNQGSLQDCNNFMNDGKLFMFSAFSCHANAFADVAEANPSLGPSMGENMLTLPLRGAVASWASTGFELVPNDGTYHLNVEFARSLFSAPPHDDELGRGLTDRGARVPLGEAIALTLLNYLPRVRVQPELRGVGLTYNLLGDPATRMWVGPAQVSVTANGQPVISGQPVRLVSGCAELRLEADVVSNVGIDSIAVLLADRSGTHALAPALYTLSPAFPDTLATGGGGRRYHLTLLTALSTGPATFTFWARDRYGITAAVDAVFQFETDLMSGGVSIHGNDVVGPDAALALLVLSPATLDPDSLRLGVDGRPQVFEHQPARGDTCGRQYLLTWSHAPYANGVHTVRLDAPGALATDHSFRIETHFALRDPLAFPNPFDEELGTRFVFTLTGEASCDVMLRVYTVSGRRVYETRLPGLSPGYHEIPWDGLDEEGQRLANGIYFYKLVAHGPSGTSSYDGRLVKLRRPRRAPDSAAGTP